MDKNWDSSIRIQCRAVYLKYYHVIEDNYIYRANFQNQLRLNGTARHWNIYYYDKNPDVMLNGKATVQRRTYSIQK